MKGIALNEAVAMIPDGATLMIGGFMGVGTPERVMDELVRQGKRDLTVIANDTAMSGVGIGKLIGAKRVRKAIVSHIGLNPETQRAEKRNVVLDTISTIHPGTRLVSQAKSMVTGTQSFVGEASLEGKITDAQCGALLFAEVDRRGGGKTLSKGIDNWADVDAAFDYWAQKLRYRLCQESGRGGCAAPAQ